VKGVAKGVRGEAPHTPRSMNLSVRVLFRIGRERKKKKEKRELRKKEK
jgi:hypothetical protein